MKKNLNQHGFSAVVVLLAILVVAVIGFAGWYVYNSQKDNKDTVGTTQNEEQDNTKATPTSTPTSTTSSDTKNELDALREFCQGTNLNTVVAGIVYVENHDGKFAECGITDKEGIGGAMLLSTYVNGKWTKMWAGNGIMDANLCTQYKIPQKIYADCPGNYE